MFEKKIVIWATLMLMMVPLSSADVLVTREGEQLQTDGPWEVKRNLVVFTTAEGVLSSIRLSEIDLEASTLATNPPAEEPVAEEPNEEGEEDGKPVLVFTNVEIPSAEEAAAARGEGETQVGEDEEEEPEDPCLPDLTLGNPVVSGKKVVFHGAMVAAKGCPGVDGIHWVWGDGTEGDGWFPMKHNYDQPGEYYLEITARNRLGKTVTKEVVVKIPADDPEQK